MIDSVSRHIAVSPAHDSRNFLHLVRAWPPDTAPFCISRRADRAVFCIPVGHSDSGHTGRSPDRSARTPLADTVPALTASAQLNRPVASLTKVSGSVSTTFGGVPRVCRGPATH